MKYLNKKRKKILFLLVDALGFDFVNDVQMPLLNTLSDKSYFYSLEPVLGYSDAQRAALFTGCLPATSGYWTDFMREPGKSPLKPFSLLSSFDKLPIDFIKRSLKYGLAKTIAPMIAKRSGYPSLPLYNIPFSVMSDFHPTLKTSMLSPDCFQKTPSIFTLLDDNNIPFHTIQTDWFGTFNLFKHPSAFNSLLNNSFSAMSDETEFLYLYLHMLDMLGHRHGIRGNTFSEVLIEMDNLIDNIISQIKTILGEDLNIVIVSDHGLNHTEEFIDYTFLLNDPRFGNEFMVALDSTMVRIWYFNDIIKENIRKLIKERSRGKFLTIDEINNFGINFEHNKYYEDIYLLEPGQSIFPNYHSYLQPYAMHAYDPKGKDQQGIALFYGEIFSQLNISQNAMKMIDVMPTIASVLELGPLKVDGKSFI